MQEASPTTARQLGLRHFQLNSGESWTMRFISLALLLNSEGIGQQRRGRLTSVDCEQESRVCRLVGADFEI